MISQVSVQSKQKTDHPTRLGTEESCVAVLERLPADLADLNGHRQDDPSRAWRQHAEDLCEWAWNRLVNRADVWGGYVPLRDRGKEYRRKDGTVGKLGNITTRPFKSQRGKVQLTKQVLRRHFRASAPEDVIGLHSTSHDNTSLWGAVDTDYHGEGGNDPDANLRASLSWYEKLSGMGFHPLLTDSNGKGGYHLRILLARPVATEDLFWFLRDLVSDHAKHGIPNRPETFPKQSKLKAGRCGNWLRLPGRHHTREHWSSVWTGECFVGGDEAVDLMLSLSGDDPKLIPRRIDRRIEQYADKLPNLGEAQGRHDVAYTFGAFLVRDMGLPDDEALAWLERWDRGNTPPLGREELLKQLRCAHEYGQHEYGAGLQDWEPSRSNQEPQPEIDQAEKTEGRGNEVKDRVHEGNGKADGHPLTPTAPQPQNPESDDTSSFRFKVIDSAAFAREDYRPQWLIKRLLVKGQPALVGGPRKALKTSLLVDLAISLGSATSFLGAFPIYKPVRVAVLSGESGEHTLQETARRVCDAKGIQLADAGVLWGFDLPQLLNLEHLGELQAGLKENRVEVLVVDPLYLCLLSGRGPSGPRAESLFDMGPLLLSISKACLSVGTTPVLIHHARKGSASIYDPLELDDLAYAGVAEFCRQWLLVSRSEKYEPGTGRHALWLNVGGSAGHSGLWAVDVDEGIVDENFRGRRWDVTVTTGAESKRAKSEERVERKEQKRQAEDKSDDAILLTTLEKLDPRREGASYNRVQVESRLSTARMVRAVSRLVQEGIIQEISVKVTIGSGATKEARGLRRKVADHLTIS
jgi:replicative DNA helicase